MFLECDIVEETQGGHSRADGPGRQFLLHRQVKPDTSESPQDRAFLVIGRSGVQTSRRVARRWLESSVRDSAPSCPRSTAFEVASWKAPLRDGICCKQRLHRFATSLVSKEETKGQERMGRVHGWCYLVAAFSYRRPG